MEIDCRVDLTSTGISTAGKAPFQQLLKLQPPAFNSDDQVTATAVAAELRSASRPAVPRPPASSRKPAPSACARIIEPRTNPGNTVIPLR
jgi:hypothetical protein